MMVIILFFIRFNLLMLYVVCLFNKSFYLICLAMVTMDMREDRVRLFVKDGKVVRSPRIG